MCKTQMCERSDAL